MLAGDAMLGGSLLVAYVGTFFGILFGFVSGSSTHSNEYPRNSNHRTAYEYLTRVAVGLRNKEAPEKSGSIGIICPRVARGPACNNTLE